MEKTLRFLLGRDKKRDCCRMDWMVLTWNEPSIQFYEKIGGTRLGWYTYRLENDQF